MPVKLLTQRTFVAPDTVDDAEPGERITWTANLLTIGKRREVHDLLAQLNVGWTTSAMYTAHATFAGSNIGIGEAEGDQGNYLIIGKAGTTVDGVKLKALFKTGMKLDDFRDAWDRLPEVVANWVIDCLSVITPGWFPAKDDATEEDPS